MFANPHKNLILEKLTKKIDFPLVLIMIDLTAKIAKIF